MRHARVMGLAGLAVLAVGAVAFAQTTVVPVPDNAPVETAPLDINLAKTTWGDAKAGQTKAAACAACSRAARISWSVARRWSNRLAISGEMVMPARWP